MQFIRMSQGVILSVHFHFDTKQINTYHGAFGSSRECRALRETLLPGLPLKKARNATTTVFKI